MQPCNRKDICYHYPKHCELCQATSDVVNTYPCFQDKDIVEVVRCKDCNFSRPLDKSKSPEKYFKNSCAVCECETVVGDVPMIYINTHFCSYGERKE